MARNWAAISCIFLSLSAFACAGSGIVSDDWAGGIAAFSFSANAFSLSSKTFSLSSATFSLSINASSRASSSVFR